MLRFPIWCFVLLFSIIGVEAWHSQINRSDSLKSAFKSAKHDTTRCALIFEIMNFEESDSLWKNYNRELKLLCEKNLLKNTYSEEEIILFKYYLGMTIMNEGYEAKSAGDMTAAMRAFHQAEAILQKSLSESKSGKIKSALGFTYIDIGEIHEILGEPKKAMQCYEKAYKIFLERKDDKGLSFALNNMGNAYLSMGDPKRAMENLNECIKIQEKNNFESDLANSSSNLGMIFLSIGNVPGALENFNKSLRSNEKLNDKRGMSNTLMNIGGVHSTVGDYNKGMECYKKSLDLSIHIKHLPLIASAYLNIGSTHLRLHNAEEALQNFNKALEIREKIQDKTGIASSLNSIGSYYTSQKNFTKAAEIYERVVVIRKSIQDKEGLATALTNLSYCYRNLNQKEKALQLGKTAAKLAEELGFPGIMQKTAMNMYDLYKEKGNYKAAIEQYELGIKMRDSLQNEKTRKASIRSQLKYEYEKQAAADSVSHSKESEIKNAELARQSAEISTKKNQQYALFGGLFCVCVFGVFMFNRFKVTQKQKEIIEQQKEVVEEQKKLVEEKQKEVLDSIQYARKIQMALIPSEKIIFSYLKKLNK